VTHPNISPDMRLRARAAAARRLIAKGGLDPHDGLMLTVWPPPELLDQEARVSYGTLAWRIYRDSA
jgi:hypothetical protein